MKVSDSQLRVFWAEIKNDGFLSGAIVDLEWDDLWDDAREWVKQVFVLANRIGG